MKNKRVKKISELLRVLGGNVRFEIILYLASGEKCVCNIFEYLKLPQNLVSHHLGILRKNGIITARKDGKWVHYSIRAETLEELKEFLEIVLSHRKGKSKC